MTGKERGKAAVARRPVDRVPLGLYAVDYDTVAAVIGRPTIVRNQIAMQTALWEGRRDEMVQQWKADLTDFYRKIDCADVITCRDAMLMPARGSIVSPLGSYRVELPGPPRKIGDNEWQDADGRIFRAVPDVNEIRCIHDPTAAKEPIFRVEDFEGPVEEPAPPDPAVFEVLDHIIEQFGQDRYIAGPCGGLTAMTLLGGFENGLVLYALQPEVVAAANRRSVAVQNARDRFYVRPGQDGAIMDQDMAGTNAPYVSPAMFRELCLPYMRQRITHVKQFAQQVVHHNCGHNIPLIDMFIEAGVDCYQSLQTTAGMEIGRLKELFPGRMCWWGGVPVEILISGTPAQTRQAVRTALQRGAPGGGFILGPSQSIPKNTRYDNFMAMLDEFVALRDQC
ncbi:MAG TPA: uroporphyrinogen decarboxylase family protein [Phycisphaerae bacterium]|nr:uroporphyrinogen decarboxylase family protein [Phycisphaerae bacterium]